MLIVGSTAAKHWLPGWRDPKDYDLFTPVQVDSADCVWTPEIGEWLERRNPGVHEAVVMYATLDELVTIKASHMYHDLRNGSWDKHAADYVALLDAGATVDWELHDLLRPGWERMHARTHGAAKTDLTKNSTDFFEDAVTRRWVHDSVHETVAYYDRPLYESCFKDGATVQMDMAKIWALSFEDQVKLFREEIYVTALERLIIPAEYKFSPGRAYQFALRRTITSLTKGASAKFLVQHYPLFRKPDIDYVARHKTRLDRLIPLEETTV